MKKEMAEVRISQLTKDPNHVRQNAGNLEELISSIRKDGQLVPINVNKSEDGVLYVNDGFRRIEALKKIGQETVLAIVHEGHTPVDAAHESFIINEKRKGLNTIEKAIHIKKMNGTFGLPFRHLEDKGYGSTAQLAKIVKLLELPEKVQTQLADGEITMAHGLVLLSLPTDIEREKLTKRAVDHEWSAQRLEKAVRRHNQESKVSTAKKASVPDTEIPGVYNKDARDMSEQPDESIHLIFGSPNYFIGKEYEQGYTIEQHWDNIEEVLKESARIIVSGGVIALNFSDILNYKGKKGDDKKTHIELVGHRYQRILKKFGFQLESQIIWVKRVHSFSTDRSKAFSDTTVHSTYKTMNCHEFIYVFRKKGERQIPTGENALNSVLTKEEWSKYIPSVWQIPHVWKSEGHPTVFPDELARRVIKMFSFVGERVLDPFLGSGTTVKVARELDREGIGYEREAKYMATIAEKLGGKSKLETESVAAYSKRILDDLEANQPGEAEVETFMSEGMADAIKKMASDKELEPETV